VTTDRAGTIVGVEAVIDKDRVSALLAVELGARRLVITTGVDAVYTGYYGARPRRLADVDVATLARLGAEGEFPPGSMGPKMEAIASFVEATGGEGLVCLPEELTEALAGRTGTRVRP
jgi:carbamate kinase